MQQSITVKWVKYMNLKLIGAQSNRAIGFNKRSEPLNYGDGRRSRSRMLRISEEISVDKILYIVIHKDNNSKDQIIDLSQQKSTMASLDLEIKSSPHGQLQ